MLDQPTKPSNCLTNRGADTVIIAYYTSSNLIYVDLLINSADIDLAKIHLTYGWLVLFPDTVISQKFSRERPQKKKLWQLLEMSNQSPCLLFD